MTSLVVKSRDLCEPYSIVSFLMDLVVFVVSMVDLLTCGAVFVWEKMNKAKADAYGPAVASGLICGDGIWTLPQSILALAKVNPPFA